MAPYFRENQHSTSSCSAAQKNVTSKPQEYHCTNYVASHQKYDCAMFRNIALVQMHALEALTLFSFLNEYGIIRNDMQGL